MAPLLSALITLFDPVSKLIDNLTLSPEEKAKLQQEQFKLQAGIYLQALEYEKESMEARANIIQAEAKSDSWLTKNWRPLVMIFFCVIVGLYWFGIVPPNAPPEVIDRLFRIIEIGLGGYVIGRSVEKVVPSLAEAIKNKKE
jgi:hypothetical protein